MVNKQNLHLSLPLSLPNIDIQIEIKMRLTNILRQLNYHRHVKRIWKKQGRLQAEELVIPPALVEMNIPIIDAKEILQETKIFKDPIPECKVLPVPPSVHVQQKCSYVMHFRTKVSESENQTLSLTKTIRYDGLPPQVLYFVGLEFSPFQADLVQTAIQQAQVWDADQRKLPIKVDVLRPGYKFRRQYGIYNKKKVSGLLEKLNFLCECTVGIYPETMNRSKIQNPFADVSVQRNGDFISFKMPCDLLFTSKQPLLRFASPEVVKTTEQESVPNIYPIKSTLDLEKVEEILPVTKMPCNFNIGYLHTIFVAQKSIGFWFPEQKLSRAIATCFTFTAMKAREMYGEDVGVLPEPICVQCVYMDMKSFNFITYQLNTLDLESNDGVKNQVWVDEAQDLYESVSEDTGVTNYNPNIFAKLLAFHLNGLAPVRAAKYANTAC